MSEPYVPPAASWRLSAFIEATTEEIEAKTVDCPTCPVQAQCVAGTGGTGWTCSKCNATGVWVQPAPGPGLVPPDVLVLDCGKHNFHQHAEAREVLMCGLCNGTAVELEVFGKPPATHLIRTIYARTSAVERQAILKDVKNHTEEILAKEPS